MPFVAWGRSPAPPAAPWSGSPPGRAEVEWQGRAGPFTTSVGREHGSCLGYGYATTLPYLRSCQPERDSLLVLGDPLAVAGRGAPVAAAWVTLAGPGMPAAGAAGMAQRRRAAIAQLATGWPDEQMLERAGPAPSRPSPGGAGPKSSPPAPSSEISASAPEGVPARVTISSTKPALPRSTPEGGWGPGGGPGRRWACRGRERSAAEALAL